MPYPSPTCRVCGFRNRRQGLSTCGACAHVPASHVSCDNCGADLHARPHEISEGKHYCLAPVGFAGCADRAKENR